jgi:hypothetical protein
MCTVYLTLSHKLLELSSDELSRRDTASNSLLSRENTAIQWYCRDDNERVTEYLLDTGTI